MRLSQIHSELQLLSFFYRAERKVRQEKKEPLRSLPALGCRHTCELRGSAFDFGKGLIWFMPLQVCP